MRTEASGVRPLGSPISAFRDSLVKLFHPQLWNPSTLLVLGLLARVVTYVFLLPTNNDTGHLENLEFAIAHGRLPFADETSQGYHPPLYYWLAWLSLTLTGSVKVTQALSLVFSILTLLVMRRVIYSDWFPGNSISRNACFFLACFMPQWILYSLYLSNDSLAILLGAAWMWICAEFLGRRGAVALVQLTLITALGLLTKATFLIFIPVLGLVIFVGLNWHARYALGTAALCVGIAALIGGYKFRENFRTTGSPFYSNLDADYQWVVGQKGSYRGLQSFLDFRFHRLLLSPAVSGDTNGAYPLLLYGTFWYPHIPESNISGNRKPPFYYLGSIIYLFALIPTFFAFRGLVMVVKDFGIRKEWLRRGDVAWRIAALLFVLNAMLLVFVVAQTHVWSVMQGRLLFPTFVGFLSLIAIGWPTRSNWWDRFAAWSVGSLAAAFGLFWVSEWGYQFVAVVWPDVRGVF